MMHEKMEMSIKRYKPSKEVLKLKSKTSDLNADLKIGTKEPVIEITKFVEQKIVYQVQGILKKRECLKTWPKLLKWDVTHEYNYPRSSMNIK